jgi:RimJ/RimL family protein N-acetyltransferase
MIHRAQWSQGYATEATRRLVRFGFDEFDLQRIEATCHPDNRASARVLEKAGFQYEGRMRDHLLVLGQWRDSLLYAAVRGR